MAKTPTERKKAAKPDRAGSSARLGAALRRRVIVEGLHPEVDAGRFPIKRSAGEDVIVEADIFTDGHDSLAAALLYGRVAAPPGTRCR